MVLPLTACEEEANSTLASSDASASPSESLPTAAATVTPASTPPAESSSPASDATAAAPGSSTAQVFEGRFTGGFSKPANLARVLEGGGLSVTGITNNFVELVFDANAVKFSSTVFANVRDTCGLTEVAETVQFDVPRGGSVGSRLTSKSESEMHFRATSSAKGCDLVVGVYNNATDPRVSVYWQVLDRDHVLGIFSILGLGPGLKLDSQFKLSRAS